MKNVGAERRHAHKKQNHTPGSEKEPSGIEQIRVTQHRVPYVVLTLRVLAPARRESSRAQ
jgi:hypothetical protein